MQHKLKVGLIGLGVMGQIHARVLTKSNVFDFIGFHDSFVPVSEGLDATSFSSFKSLLSAEPDVVIIAAPTVWHHELAKEAIENGVAFLVEKPITQTVEQAEEIVSLASEFGVKGAVGHIERFNPATLRMKELLKSGFLGEILQITTVRTGPFPNRVSDVGVARDLASHDIDLARWLSDSDYDSLNKVTKSRPTRQHEDLFIAAGQLKNGALVNHVVNWLSPIKERETRVLGERGMLVADTLKSELYFHEVGSVMSEWEQSTIFRGPVEGNSTRFALERVEPVLSEHLALKGLLTQDRATQIATLEDGLKVLKTLDS